MAQTEIEVRDCHGERLFRSRAIKTEAALALEAGWTMALVARRRKCIFRLVCVFLNQ
jgi:hypothetical protein